MKKAVIGILYSVLSILWLFLAILFTSALWLEKPGTNDWQEDFMFIPIGIIMLVIWSISFIVLLFRLKRYKRSVD